VLGGQVIVNTYRFIGIMLADFVFILPVSISVNLIKCSSTKPNTICSANGACKDYTISHRAAMKTIS